MNLRGSLQWLLLAMSAVLVSLPGVAQVQASLQAEQASGAQQPEAGAAPLTITLQDALQRARSNSPQFQAALTELKLSHEDRVQARAALLPNVNFNTQFIYTEGNGTPSGRFIANNGVHEYLSQGNAHQVLNLGAGQIADYQRSAAAEALARAKSEIAARGLVVTVTQSYYGLVVAQRKYVNAQEAVREAAQFRTNSRQREEGGEVAHADVIKAELQHNDRLRDLREAELAMNRARLALAVLLFPNFDQNFSVVDDLRLPPTLPSRDEVAQLAQKNNPEIRAALAALQVASKEVVVARSAHFPTVSFDYFYGIDANQFATHSNGVRNLGYMATATLNLPVWNWGATQSRVKQAVYRREQAQLEMTFAQKQLLSNLSSLYDEAAIAREQLDTLRNSADMAAESLRLTTLRYQAGEATVLEVVDAQNTLTQARNVYDDGEARYRLALADLQTLTGVF